MKTTVKFENALMRFLIPLALMTFLVGCATTQDGAAVRDGSADERRAHAESLIGNDLPEIRETGEDLLTTLACAWNEPSCPSNK